MIWRKPEVDDEKTIAELCAPPSAVDNRPVRSISGRELTGERARAAQDRSLQAAIERRARMCGRRD